MLNPRSYLHGALLAIVAGVLSALPGNAAGLSVRPASLRLSGPAGEPVAGEFLVTNIMPEPAAYTIQPPDGVALAIEPEAFQLNPGASERVALRYRPSGWRTRSVDVLVVARPLQGSAIRIATGIRYPVELAAEHAWVGAAVRGIVLGALSVLAAYLLRHNRSRSYAP
ncbi:MAG: hypothetical protein G01um101431_1108 [Parcubacteria group bacterium Gr01-1014_31]|nr:MAG: hypothetical protein G01um101431_1108 [Parcubacteria group bacterium Gr01-1014_31]